MKRQHLGLQDAEEMLVNSKKLDCHNKIITELKWGTLLRRTAYTTANRCAVKTQQEERARKENCHPWVRD